MPAPRRAPTVLGLSAALLLAVAGCTADPGSPESSVPTAGTGSSPDYLWALSATDGSLVGTDDEKLYLQLWGVAEAVTRFSDHPDRLASAVDLRDFLGRWEGRFSEDPPNAVLSYQPDDAGVQQQIVVTLSRPRWDASTGSLLFAAERIRKEADDLAGTDHPLDPAKIDNPIDTGPLAVFIDGAGDVGSSGTIGEYSAPGSAALLDALRQLHDEGFREQVTDLANEIARMNLLIGELMAVQVEFTNAVASSTALSPELSAVLEAADLRASDPPVAADADAYEARLDALEETVGLEIRQLQDLVQRESDREGAIQMILAKLAQAESEIIPNFDR